MSPFDTNLSIESNETFIHDIEIHMQKALILAKQNGQKNRDDAFAYYNKNRKTPNYKVKKQVLLLNSM